jgi:hypothetical protein
MGFDPIPPDAIQAYLGELGNTGQVLSVILTDGTMLTGGYKIGGDWSRPLTLEVFEHGDPYRVAIPAGRIAGMFEQVTSGPPGAQAPDPSLLVPAAARAGLKVESEGSLKLLEPGAPWTPAPTMMPPYREDAILYFDADAISARSGGINSIGFGLPAFSTSVGWNRKLVSVAKGFLKNHVVEIGSHCAAPRADLTLKGFVEFWDVSRVQPSSESGPLLDLEGTQWIAAVMRPSPPGARAPDEPWALCYFRHDRLSLGPGSWEHIGQPVSVYGDKQPREQTLDLGVAPCYLMARAAACLV